ncbi:Antigen, partial [Armadillidium nasatum]
MTFSYLELVILFFGIQISILPLTKGYGGPFYEKLTQQDLDETFNKIDETPKASHVIVLKEPVYLIVAPRIVRAGQLYRLVVNVLPPSPSLMVVATLFKDNIQVDVVEKECSRDEPQIFQIMVPPSSGYGHYRLKLEGNEMVGSLVLPSATKQTLYSVPEEQLIFIQLEKKIYSQGSTGAINLDFPLSRETEMGQWKIRVEATNSFSEEYFTVEEFVDPLFEIAVDVPSFLPSSSKFLEGTVSANYSSGAPLAGEVTIKMALKPLTDHNIPYYGTKPITVERRRKFNGFFKFRFQLDDFQDLLSWSDGLEVRIMAYVKDFLLESSDMGFGTLRIFPSGINLDFLGDSPFIIRPSMPFQYYLIASSRDGSHVSKDLLRHHRLHVTPEVRFKSSKVMRLKSRALKMAHDQYGLWRGEIDLTGEI